MVKLRMVDSKILKTSISAIANLIEEATFKLMPEGIRMKAMDPSHVALVDFDLPAEAFAEYGVKQTASIGINIAEINKIMARAKSEDELIMELDEEKNRLELTFKGASTRKFSISLIDISEAELPEPKLQFTATADILAGVIQDGLKDAELVGDNITCGLTEEGFSMSTRGDKGATELKLHKGDSGLLKISVKQPARAMFNVVYLVNMTKAASSADTITMNLGENLPIQLDFPVADGKGRLRFLLAPRIEAE